ncbi:MAG: DUF938 domain-containing protein [Planctomycetota bacterium]
MKKFAESAERNCESIWENLGPLLPESGLVLEIASGTGQHVVHYAERTPELTWQPTDVEPENITSIAHYVAEAELKNVRTPLLLDVTSNEWPVKSADVVVCINMIHIAPWKATRGLFRGAARVLGKGGLLFLYGPYLVEGRETEPSNLEFDADLKSRDASWGLRKLEDVGEVGEKQGLELVAHIDTPKNNLSVIFRRT